MATSIGYVKKQSDGSFKGVLKTLNVRQPIAIIPNSAKAHDKQPDYRVYSRGVPLGAAWTKQGKTSGNPYVSLRLSAPELGPKRVYANLGRAAGQDDDDAFVIIWNPEV